MIFKLQQQQKVIHTFNAIPNKILIEFHGTWFYIPKINVENHLVYR